MSYTSEENVPPRLLVAFNHQEIVREDWTLLSPSPIHDWVLTDPVCCSPTAAVSFWAQDPCHGQSDLPPCLPALAISPPLPWCSLSPGEYCINVFFRTWLSAITYSLNILTFCTPWINMSKSNKKWVCVCIPFFLLSKMLSLNMA